MNIKIPKTFAGKPIKGAIKRVLAKSEKTNKTPKNENKNSDINIQSIDDYWQIQGVNYMNEIKTINLAQQLLPNMTQDKHAEYREQAISKGEFYTGDMPLYHAVFTALFNQKDKPESEQARQFIKKSMREKWLMTLTRIAYQPRGKDKIIHNYNTKDEYSLEENIVGEDRFIEDADRSALKALLGTDNIQEIKDIYNWINGTDTYIWRINSKPNKVDERITRFDAVSDRADLDCDWDPAYRDPSLGVCVMREAHSQKN